jgi:hypothetical protein
MEGEKVREVKNKNKSLPPHVDAEIAGHSSNLSLPALGPHLK